MRAGAGLVILAMAVCFPGFHASKRCEHMKAWLAAANATGVAQADETDWSGPPGTLVRISAPEEPFLPVTFPLAENRAPAADVAGPAPQPIPAGERVARTPSSAAALSPYVTRTASIPPRSALDVERQLNAWGFTQVTGLEMRGGSYLCEATGPRRERVRLVVDARSGEISGLEVIGFEGKRY